MLTHDFDTTAPPLRAVAPSPIPASFDHLIGVGSARSSSTSGEPFRKPRKPTTTAALSGGMSNKTETETIKANTTARGKQTKGNSKVIHLTVPIDDDKSSTTKKNAVLKKMKSPGSNNPQSKLNSRTTISLSGNSCKGNSSSTLGLGDLTLSAGGGAECIQHDQLPLAIISMKFSGLNEYVLGSEAHAVLLARSAPTTTNVHGICNYSYYPTKYGSTHTSKSAHSAYTKNADADSFGWKEIEQIIIDDFTPGSIYSFHLPFLPTNDGKLRVELYTETYAFLGAIECSVCRLDRNPQGAEVLLNELNWNIIPSQLHPSNIKSSDIGKLSSPTMEDKQLTSPISSQPSTSFMPSITLIMNRINSVNHVVVLDITIRINRKVGWPFSFLANPFFVIYGREYTGQWMPYYRSEVRTIPLDLRGLYKFKMVEMDVSSLQGFRDDQMLRIEFFHYGSKNSVRLLGYVETFLAHLRHTSPDTPLNMETNIFPEGEIFGELNLQGSYITSTRSHFELCAEFGGVSTGDFIYFDVSTTVERRGWPFNAPRTFFVLFRIEEDGSKLPIHRSDMLKPNLKNNCTKFEVAKFTARKLHGNDERRSLRIEFFQYKSTNGHKLMGVIETSLAALRQTALGSKLAMEAGDGSTKHCFLQIKQIEISTGRSYFAIHGFFDVQNNIAS